MTHLFTPQVEAMTEAMSQCLGHALHLSTGVEPGMNLKKTTDSSDMF